MVTLFARCSAAMKTMFVKMLAIDHETRVQVQGNAVQSMKERKEKMNERRDAFRRFSQCSGVACTFPLVFFYCRGCIFDAEKAVQTLEALLGDLFVY